MFKKNVAFFVVFAVKNNAVITSYSIHYTKLYEKLNSADTETRKELLETSAEQFQAIKLQDLEVISFPYIFIGFVLIIILVIYRLSNMPKNFDTKEPINLKATLKRFSANRRYKEGVIAQFFYVGAEVMCWTFIIHYGVRVFMAEGITEKVSEQLALKYNIYAMITFGICRFLFTYLMNYIKPGKLLKIASMVAMVFTICLMLADGRIGSYNFV